MAKKIDTTSLNYKNPISLGKFVSPQGYIVPRSKSDLSQKQQRRLTREIKRARHLAMLPFTQTV